MAQTYKLSVTTNHEDAVRLAAVIENIAAEEMSAIACYEAQDDQWCVDVYFVNPPHSDLLKQIMQASVDLSLDIGTLDIVEIEEEDWVSKVQKDLAPVVAGRFFIHGSHDSHLALDHPLAIEIDAGQAFGTAHHGTTRGCLIALDKYLSARPCDKILDLGTGTGILAIAAALFSRQMSKSDETTKFAASQIIASDVDAVSVEVAHENAEKNHLQHRIEFIHADGFAHPVLAGNAPYDLIIANILAEPLITLAPRVFQHLASGGLAILSGLLDEQREKVTTAYLDAGFSQVEHLSYEGWTTLIFSKP